MVPIKPDKTKILQSLQSTLFGVGPGRSSLAPVAILAKTCSASAWSKSHMERSTWIELHHLPPASHWRQSLRLTGHHVEQGSFMATFYTYIICICVCIIYITHTHIYIHTRYTLHINQYIYVFLNLPCPRLHTFCVYVTEMGRQF